MSKDVRRKRDSLDYSFEMQSNGQVVRACYTGIVPDTFKNDSEVVLKGTLDAGRLPCDGDDGEVPVEVRGAGHVPGAAGTPRANPEDCMASLGYYLLLAAFVVCAYAAGGLGGRRAPPVSRA